MVAPSVPSTPSRAVVVVNYASHLLLEQHLGTLNATSREFRIVVVDNWSSDSELAAVQALASRHGWNLVALPDNRGFGAAVNAGIVAARELGCVSFLLLNPDAGIELDVVNALHEHSIRSPLAMITPRIIDSTGVTVFRGAHLDLGNGRVSSRGLVPATDSGTVPSRRPRRTTAWLTGACVALHADLLDRIGGFDEDYFMYWEDVDLSYRCMRAGGTLVVRDDLVVVHDEGGTQGPRRGRAKSALYYRFNCRNRLLFAARNLNRADTARWMAGSFGAGYQILLQGGRRQFLQSPHVLIAALLGTLNGLALAASSLFRSRRRTQEGPPTVLVVHPSGELYGSDRVLIESVEALTASGADVKVVLPESGPLEAALKARGVNVAHCPMPVLRKEALRPAGLVRLVRSAASSLVPTVRLLTGRPVDRLYVNTLTIPSWLVLGRLLGIPVVCHVHEAERSVPALVRLLLAAPVALAHRVVVNSNFSLDVLAESLPMIRHRATVVYNAVAGPAHSRPARPALGGPLRLLYLGRLSARKGPQVAIAVAAILRDRGVDVRLQVLGSVFPGYEWFEKELCAQVADAGLTGHVEFLGFRPDVWPFVQQADIVLVPSVADEPFGNTAVEAALAGRPLVVSHGSGLREATAGMSAVFRVDPARPDCWADAIQRIVRSWPEQVSLAERDASSAALRFSQQRYRDQLVAVVLPSPRV